MADSSAMSTSNQYIKYHISVYQNSQDTNNNLSNVTVHVYFWRTNTGYETYGSGTVYCRINGQLYSQAVSNSQKITSSGITLFNMTLNIPHDADGTKVLTTSAWIQHDRVTSSEQSYNYALTTIPRASQPTLSDVGDMGTSITIYTNRASTNFTHKVVYAFGNLSGTIATDVRDSCTWTIPESFASEIPNATSGFGSIYVDTYNGSTYIGTKSVNFTTTVPSSVVPTISTISLTDPNGCKTTYGGYVQTKSKVKVNVTSAGVYGSTITKTEITCLGVKTTKNPYTSNVISDSGGSKTVSVKVTDSRGRTATKTSSFTVLGYTQPKINNISAVRCQADGTLDDAGDYVKITYKASITSLSNKNTSSFIIDLKKKSDTTWTSVLNDSTVYSVDSSSIVAADTNTMYDIRFVVTDAFGSINRVVDLPTAFTLMDFNSSGKGLAIGKVSEKDALEINMDTWLKNLYMFGVNIIDYFYPVGTQIYNSSAWYDPNTVFTGTTWKRIKGVVLAGIDDTDTDTNLKTCFNQTEGTIIGSKKSQKHAHAFDSNGLNHTFKWGGTNGTVHVPVDAQAGNGGNNYLNTIQNTDNATLTSGDGDAENIQPTQLTYIWERIL